MQACVLAFHAVGIGRRAPLFRSLLLLALCVPALPAAADTVKLANGDTLNGKVVEWAVDHLVLDHEQLGRIRLSLEDLAIDTGTPPTPGLLGTRFLRGWKRTVTLGLSGKQGNSENTNATGGFDFSYEDEFKRWKLNGRYYLNADETGTTDHNGRVDLRRDWLYPGSDWFAFAALRYQYDEFESWLHRTVLTFGPGYHLYRSEAQTLDLRLGATFTREFGERDTNKGEALFAFDWRWALNDRQSLSLTNEIYSQFRPSLGEFRNVTLAEWKLMLTERPNLNLVIGAENEYETDVDPGDEKNDIKYYLALGLDF